MIKEHLEKLVAFHQAAVDGSVRKASQKLGRTQPAVSKAIKHLESQMRCRLFVRNPRGVSLTPQGKMLNDFCEALFLRLRDLEKRITSGNHVSGTIKIGTHETLDEIFFPRFLNRLNEKFPDIVVELTTESVQTQWPKLDAGAIDIIVGLEPGVSERFYSRVLYSDDFGVFCQINSKFLGNGEVIPVAYVKKPFEILGIDIEHFLTKMEPRFRLRYAVDSFITVRALIGENVSVGVLPVLYANKMVREKSLVKFPTRRKRQSFCKYRVCATCVDDMRQDPRISEVIRVLKFSTKEFVA